MIDLSIIIVSFNTARLTRECLQSVFDRAGSLRLEVIVVDNHSTDGSVDMIREQFPPVRLVANAQNVGFAAANNQALQLAAGKYVLLLNSDTLILGDVLRDSVRYMECHPDVGALGCRVLNPDRTLQITCSAFPNFVNLALMTLGLDKLSWPRWLDRYRWTRWDRTTERDVAVVTGCYLLTRKSVIADVGLFDESFFFYGEETDWCRRCADKGWTVRFAPVGEIIHYGSASSRSLNHRRDLLLSRGLVLVNRKHQGAAAGIAVAVLLLLFNFSRFLGYAALRLVRVNPARERSRHFGQVVRQFGTVWT